MGFFIHFKVGVLPDFRTINSKNCQSLNSHYFHIIGDKLINPIPQGFYIPIIRIPYLKVGWVYPQHKELIDPGTCDQVSMHIVQVPMLPHLCRAEPKMTDGKSLDMHVCIYK